MELFDGEPDEMQMRCNNVRFGNLSKAAKGWYKHGLVRWSRLPNKRRRV